jgi:iron complex outermembrane recepter protein
MIMKSTINAATTAVIVMLCSFPITAFSEEPDIPVIIITASSIEQSRQQANTPVTVIDQQMIQNSNSGSVAELLRGHAGLHVADLFGDGSQASIDLRGFGPTASSNTLILIDGKRLNNSADGAAPDLSTINLDDIERIEIRQGSSGVLYGNQAVGGVINIIRKDIIEDKASISLRTGSYSSTSLQGNIQRVIGKTELSLSLSDLRTDNYRDHNDSDRQEFNLRVEHQHESFNGYVEVGLTDEHYLTPGALLQNELDVSRTQSLPFYKDDYFDTKTKLLRIGVERTLDENRSIVVDLSKRINDREFIQTFRPYPGTVTTQDRDTTNLTAAYRIVPALPQLLSSLIFGLELERTNYDLLSSLGPQSIDQNISDIYLSSQWSLSERSQLDAGLRYSDKKADISGDNFNDSQSVFSLGYSLNFEALRLFARADQSFRYPTVEEHTNVPFGEEPGLKTQHGVSVELGTEYSQADSRYRATLYAIRLKDEIGFDSSGFSNMNIEQTLRRGLLLETSHDLSNSISMDISLTLLNAEISDGPFKGNRMPLVPEKTARIGFSYQQNDQLTYNLELMAVDDQVLGGDFANELDKLSPYSVTNFHVAYKAKLWQLAFRINNLMDEKYAEQGSKFTEYDPITFAPTNHEAFFPAPERNYWLTAKYTF